MESRLALPVRARRDRGDRRGPGGRGARHGGRTGASRSAVVAPALGRHLTRRRAAGPDRTEADRPRPPTPPGEPEFTLSPTAPGFALAVLAIMLAEQTFLNAGPLLVRATEGERGAALAGFVFNVLLLARAPLVLFQAVQTSILPHLTRLWVGAGRRRGDVDPFRRSVNLTLAAIGVFAGSVALVMAVVGPPAHGPRLRRRLRLRARRPRARLARDGALPVGGHHQPGAARAGPRPPGGALLGGSRGCASSPSCSRRRWTTRCCPWRSGCSAARRLYAPSCYTLYRRA